MRRTLSGRIQQSFLRRIESLPEDARELLFVAAAEPVGDVTLLLRALDTLGIAADSVVPAENAGLIEDRSAGALSAPVRAFGGLPRRNPRGAPPRSRCARRRDRPRREPDRRAWHRAHATAAPDETVAVELERCASRAQARAGPEAAAAFLERAAELTPEVQRRGERAMSAAQAKFDAGALAAAEGLLAVAAICPLDELESRASRSAARPTSRSRARAAVTRPCC